MWNDATFVGHTLLAQPTSKPCRTFKNKSRLHFLNHFNHPQPIMPLLKGVIISYVISANLNLSCVSVKGCPINCIFFTYKTSGSFFPLCNTHSLPFFRDHVSPYMWFYNDVISTSNIVWILELWILDPPSITFIIAIKLWSSQFPFFFKIIYRLLDWDHKILSGGIIPPSWHQIKMVDL